MKEYLISPKGLPLPGKCDGLDFARNIKRHGKMSNVTYFEKRVEASSFCSYPSRHLCLSFIIKRSFTDTVFSWGRIIVQFSLEVVSNRGNFFRVCFCQCIPNIISLAY